MAGVGGVACSFVRITLRPLRQRVETWHVPGLAGQAALLLGASDGDFAARAVLYDTHANVITWHLSLVALQGSVISIVDDWNSTTINCLVVRVGELVRAAARGNGGGECRAEVAVEGLIVA